MSDTIHDAKLKNLIQICKETENYKKLSVVSFALTNNVIESIGVHLGLRIRKRKEGERMFEYMELINQVFISNLKVAIFKEHYIDKVRECEILFLKNNGELPLSYIKEMYQLYYELRKIQVPNLHKNFDNDGVIGSSDMGLYPLFSPIKKRKQKESDSLRLLILQRIRQKEHVIQKDLQRNFNSNKLETAIFLKRVKHSISNKNEEKITIQGALKDNISYHYSLQKILGFFLLGVIFIMLSYGVILLIELLLLPSYSGDLSFITLLLFGGTFPLIYVYFKQFIKKRG